MLVSWQLEPTFVVLETLLPDIMVSKPHVKVRRVKGKAQRVLPKSV